MSPGAAQAARAASYVPHQATSPAFLYVDDSPQDNDVTLVNGDTSPGALAHSPDAIVVLDHGPGVEVETSTCAPLPSGAACTSALHGTTESDLPEFAFFKEWTRLEVELGPGNDRIRVRGFEGNAFLQIIGDDGDDHIDVRNENAEYVQCGPGSDTALVNSHDIADESCEQVVVRNCLPAVVGCEVEDVLQAAVRR